MKHNAEIISDDNGIEILVGYDYDEEKGYYAELGNPSTWVQPSVFTQLTSVEIVIIGKGVDILPLLSRRQINFIINKLTYNE